MKSPIQYNVENNSNIEKFYNSKNALKRTKCNNKSFMHKKNIKNIRRVFISKYYSNELVPNFPNEPVNHFSILDHKIR